MLNGEKAKLTPDGFCWRIHEPCTLVISIATIRDTSNPLSCVTQQNLDLSADRVNKWFDLHAQEWKTFWSHSWIKLDDKELEGLWYYYNYLLASGCRKGAIAPGLYGPWIVEDESYWGGAYVFDYNIQQTFAATLSCNHPELMEPYLDTIEYYAPEARKNAKNIGKDGLVFPHELFADGAFIPGMSYPMETPYAVMPFWEYYLHTLDDDFLKNRAYPLISACADFVVSMANKDDDGFYFFYPTRSAEHHGRDHSSLFQRHGMADLGFGRYILKAAIEAAGILGEVEDRADRWKDVLAKLRDFPTMHNQQGKVFLDCELSNEALGTWLPPVMDERTSARPSKCLGNHGAWMYYNCPINMMHIWPGNQIDTDSPPDLLLTAIRTWSTAKNEGSNDLVFRYVIASRLGLNAYLEFKQSIAERRMKNGLLCTRLNDLPNRDLLERGRYFQFWKNGLYMENCGVPLVINEMLLQGQNGVIKLFPTYPSYRTAEFHNLRVQGGFLVSAESKQGFVTKVEITPTTSRQCRVRLPWPKGSVQLRNPSGENVKFEVVKEDIVFFAHKRKVYILQPILASEIIQQSEGNTSQ